MAALPPGCRPIIDPDDPRRAVLPGYAAGEDGRVFRLSPAGKWIPLRIKVHSRTGCHSVRLVVAGRERNLSLASVILRAFGGPRPLGHEALHFPDTDPGNNRAENLRWAPKGSSKLGRQFGTPPTPGPRKSLDEDAVRHARDLYRAGFSHAEIAERYEVAPETIRRALTGETWGHVPDPLGPIEMRPRSGPVDTSAEESPGARLRAERESRGISRAELAARLGMSYNNLAYIESDAKRLKLDTIYRVATAIGCDPHAIDPTFDPPGESE